MSVSKNFSLDDAALRRNFNRCLERAVSEGIPAHSESGLSIEVEDAIAAVALAFPNGEGLTAKARRAFEEQLPQGAVGRKSTS